MHFAFKDGQVSARRMGLCEGNSGKGDNPGKGLEVRKKLKHPGSYILAIQSYRSMKDKLELRKTEERKVNALGVYHLKLSASRHIVWLFSQCCQLRAGEQP